MKEHLDIVRKRHERDAYAGSLGIVLDELTATTIRMYMQVRGDMRNFFGRPHGAAIYSLADAAFSVLGNNMNNLSVALDSLPTTGAPIRTRSSSSKGRPCQRTDGRQLSSSTPTWRRTVGGFPLPP